MSALAERPLLYSARPKIKLAGELRPELAAAVLHLSVTETVDGLYSLEASFGNWGANQREIGYLYFNRELFDFGTEIEVTIGAGQAEGIIFKGRITAIEGRFPGLRPPEILILAEDRFQDLRMTRHTRSFEDSTIDDVVRAVAADLGMQKQVDVAPLTLPVITQVNQSDLAFLRDLARIVDAEVWISENTIYMQPRSRRNNEEVTLVYGQTLHEFSVAADLAHQRTSIRVTGWDVNGKTAINERATETAIASELENGLSGSAILTDKFAERIDQIAHQSPLTSREAKARAEAHYRHRARRFLCGRGIGEGDARIRVGSRVTLGELGTLFNGSYYVSEARHMFDNKNGFRTYFMAEKPGLGRS